MSKFGVGVGEEFPLDDENGDGGGGDQSRGPRTEADDRADYEEWKRRREAWRAQREEWRAHRDSWRAGKRAFKQKIREAARESFGERGGYRDDRYGRGHWHPMGLLWLLIPVLAILVVFSLVSAVFKAPFVFLALFALGAFVLMHRGPWRHHRHYDYYGPRGPIPAPPPAQPPAAPPPTTGNGG